ncbi:MAG: hypothetical protein ACI9BW_001876 [Gammaproteobacteria bacterium]|jgi:hypothetical protein
MLGTSAQLACRCGACQITICDPRVRFRIECLCFDCRQRALISASKGPANALSQSFSDYQRGVDLYYFANALIVPEESRLLLEYSKLREDAFNVTAMSTCCGTVMCGAPPVFEGGAIWATPDTCTINGASGMAPQFYLFSNDFPEDKCAALPLSNTIPTLGSAFEEMRSPLLQTLLRAIRAPIDVQSTQPGYTTFEQLYAEQDLKVDNSCFEQSRAGR